MPYETPRRLDIYIEKAMHEWQVPGLAVAAVQDDTLLFARGYGLREVGTEAPVDERSLFSIGSCTKAFTSAALAMLVDEGRLAWDDSVIEYLPEFQLYDAWVTRELTVRDLLTHRCGLAPHDALWYGSDYDRDEILRRVRHIKPSIRFRSQPEYNNLMYLAAGQIIPALTGQSWDEFVRERIFAPLGMKASNTSITDPDWAGLDGHPNIAAPHATIEGKVQSIPWRNLDNIAPAGSINSSAIEMAQWLRLHLSQGTFEGEQLLSAAVVKEMHEPQFLIHAWDTVASVRQIVNMGSHFWTYGLGWFVTDYLGRKMVWHIGGIDGMGCAAGIIPEENIGVVVLTNKHYAWIHFPLMLWTFDELRPPRAPSRGEPVPHRDWCCDFQALEAASKAQKEEAQTEMAESRVEGTHPSLPLSRYVGSFEYGPYGQVTVGDNDGKLFIEFSPAYIGDLAHWHHDTFHVTWRNPILDETYLTYNFDSDGQVSGIKIDSLQGHESH